jgi:hypothetical protein
MAGRTIRWLLSKGYIVEKRDGGSVAGERMIALTRSGAALLSQVLPLPGDRPHARDWLRHAHGHRTACNSVYASVAATVGNLDVGWTELEIRAGTAPEHLSRFGYRTEDEVLQKIPDLLLHFNDDAPPVWVEVENAWRGARDFQKLIGFLRTLFGARQPPVSKAWFVATNPVAKTIGKRLRAALTHGPESGYGRQVRELDADILAHRVQVFELNADTLELRALTTDHT